MKNEPDDLFETALNSLKERSGEVELSGFEHHVWSEIAIRDERGSLLQWLQGGRFLMPAPATAAVAIVAIGAGITLGFAQAESYGKQASLALEQRYVESIHPVMMSANHVGSHTGH
ncbi:MAG: hypothetical protein KDN22_13925 [Verrucomicrobiae bacterium]|nr:hypothetical protein [Verrucomicrobiae bacterium]